MVSTLNHRTVIVYIYDFQLGFDTARASPLWRLAGEINARTHIIQYILSLFYHYSKSEKKVFFEFKGILSQK